MHYNGCKLRLKKVMLVLFDEELLTMKYVEPEKRVKIVLWRSFLSEKIATLILVGF